MKNFDDYIDDSGVITTKNIVADNQSKVAFYKYLKENEFQQISRGIYAPTDAWVDPLQIAHARCPRGVISHDVALHYYGLIDREPETTTLTIYSGYNTSRLKAAGYKVYFVKKEYLDVGRTVVTDFDGNIVPMYDLERTICDLVRNRNNFEIQDFNTALKSYVRKKDKNISKLFEYAKLLRVENLMRSYLEVLL